MNRPLRGVNLGGWLVLESWLSPGLFKGTGAVDEFTLCQNGNIQALRRFRDEFITEADFEWLANNGIETIRLPVGYWLFGDQKPYDKTVQYVDEAFVWAAKHGITILLDVHGLPGSQNGKIHSGQQGDFLWHTSPDYIEQTYDFLRRLAARYGTHSALLGISLINEPSPKIPRRLLKLFYEKAYRILREACGPEVWIVFSDAFKHRRWRRVLPRKDYPGLHIDHHQYQIYMRLDKLLSARLQLWRTKYILPGKLRRIARKHPLIIGEWSGAMRASKARPELQSAFAAAQIVAFDDCAAWFYWTYKTEGGGIWSYRDCIERGTLRSL